MRNGPTSLYRLHDAQGGLLCVGIAGNPAAVPRARRHQSVVGQVGWINVEHYETRSEAEAAETKAIRTERPEYNVAQVSDPLSGLPRISSVFTGLVYGNPPCVDDHRLCLAVAYGALMFMPGAEFARNPPADLTRTELPVSAGVRGSGLRGRPGDLAAIR